MMINVPRTLACNSMTRQMMMRIVTAVAVIASAALPCESAAQTTQPPCVQGHCPGELADQTFPRAQTGFEYTVNIPDSFNASQQAAIRAAFDNWQYAGSNLTGVRYRYTYGPNEYARSGVIEMFPTESCDHTNLGCVGPGYGVPNSYAISVSAWLVDNASITNIVAHEIGHTMGLADCWTCCPGTSVMASASGSPTGYPNGRSGPSACDAEKANDEVGKDEPPPPDEWTPTGGGDDPRFMDEKSGFSSCDVQYTYSCNSSYTDCYILSYRVLRCY
ncbi:MAG TPA: hypothetical protein VE010_22080 [Thermoanaerobaculia bacterium]|nr:hypothetical protein [Thermoanaerobaculia bacterium]